MGFVRLCTASDSRLHNMGSWVEHVLIMMLYIVSLTRPSTVYLVSVVFLQFPEAFFVWGIGSTQIVYWKDWSVEEPTTGLHSTVMLVDFLSVTCMFSGTAKFEAQTILVLKKFSTLHFTILLIIQNQFPRKIKISSLSWKILKKMKWNINGSYIRVWHTDHEC